MKANEILWRESIRIFPKEQPASVHSIETDVKWKYILFAANKVFFPLYQPWKRMPILLCKWPLRMYLQFFVRKYSKSWTNARTFLGVFFIPYLLVTNVFCKNRVCNLCNGMRGIGNRYETEFGIKIEYESRQDFL